MSKAVRISINKAGVTQTSCSTIYDYDPETKQQQKSAVSKTEVGMTGQKKSILVVLFVTYRVVWHESIL